MAAPAATRNNNNVLGLLHMCSSTNMRHGNIVPYNVISPYIFLLCVEILALKVNHTKTLTGVVYAKKEARSEIFADDFSAMVLRTEENLRNFSKILILFHSVSGLTCNLD